MGTELLAIWCKLQALIDMGIRIFVGVFYHADLTKRFVSNGTRNISTAANKKNAESGWLRNTVASP